MSHKRGILVLGVVVALGLFVGLAEDAAAATTNVNWSTEGGAAALPVGGSNWPLLPDSATTSITGINGGVAVQAASFLSVSMSGAYMVMADAAPNDYSGSVAFTIDIQHGGTWLQVWSGSLTHPADGSAVISYLNSLGPIPFYSSYLVTGIRLGASADANAVGAWTYLTSGSGTVFTLDTDPNPEPATLLLVGLGVGGLAWHRRRKHRKAIARG